MVELLGDVYPELIAGEATVSALLRAEEQRFARTLETGAQLLEQVLGNRRGGVRRGCVSAA